MKKTSTKRAGELGGKGNTQGTMNITEFWPYKPIVHEHTRICTRKWRTQNSWGFCDKIG